MRAIRVGQVRRILCASPDYLESNGIPGNPAELTSHNIIASSGVSPTNEWKFNPELKPSIVKVKPKLTVSSNDAAIEAACQGIGITRLLSYQVVSQLASGQLKIILQDFETPPLPIHVLHREGRYASAKIRAFVDLIAAKLKKEDALS